MEYHIHYYYYHFSSRCSSQTISGQTKWKQQYNNSGLPTLCLKKVWKPREVLTVRVTAGHRPYQAQEGASRVEALFRLLPESHIKCLLVVL